MREETFGSSTYEADLAVPEVAAHLVRFSVDRPTNRLFHGHDRYWIDMCLTPRPENTRGCYQERWGPHRYERLGEIFLVPPGQSLHVLAESQETDQLSVVCEIGATAVEQWNPGGIEWTDNQLAAALDITDDNMRACLFRLAAEVRRPGLGSDVLVRAIAAQLAIEVARYCQVVAEGPAVGGLASWRLRLIDERLRKDGFPPTLEELAALCSLSIRQLTRGFRSARGCSIGDHIANSRIAQAKRLLGTSRTIKGIAFDLGFASPSSFSCAFRRATGSTPRHYRARQLRQRG